MPLQKYIKLFFTKPIQKKLYKLNTTHLKHDSMLQLELMAIKHLFKLNIFDHVDSKKMDLMLDNLNKMLHLDEKEKLIYYQFGNILESNNRYLLNFCSSTLDTISYTDEFNKILFEKYTEVNEYKKDNKRILGTVKIHNTKGNHRVIINAFIYKNVNPNRNDTLKMRHAKLKECLNHLKHKEDIKEIDVLYDVKCFNKDIYLSTLKQFSSENKIKINIFTESNDIFEIKYNSKINLKLFIEILDTFIKKLYKTFILDNGYDIDYQHFLKTFRLRQHQIDANIKLMDLYKNKSGGFILHTQGSGKTYTGSYHLIKNILLNPLENNLNNNVLVLCSINNFEQWYDSINILLNKYDLNREITLIKCHKKNIKKMNYLIKHPPNKCIFISTEFQLNLKDGYNQLLQHFKFKCVLIDEIQKFRNIILSDNENLIYTQLANDLRNAIEYKNHNIGHIIGLTATPSYNRKEDYISLLYVIKYYKIDLHNLKEINELMLDNKKLVDIFKNISHIKLNLNQQEKMKIGLPKLNIIHVPVYFTNYDQTILKRFCEMIQKSVFYLKTLTGRLKQFEKI